MDAKVKLPMPIVLVDETVADKTQLPERISFNGNFPGQSFVKAAPDWRTVLAKAVADNPKGKAGVAIQLGVCRSYVARVLSGATNQWALKSVPRQFIDRVIDRLYMVTACPHTGKPQPVSECRAIALTPAPTHHPMRMAVWKSCQRCPSKPITKETS